ncbi:MAG: FAD-dependent oxidoreductase [Candidatus Thermoplasmatota archaeon]
MSDNDIIIIGGGAGGGTAAQFARKNNRDVDITIFEKGVYPQYSKCGLPYAISGVIPDVNNLIEFNEDWFKKERINLLLGTTVEKIDINKRVIIAKKNNEYLEKDFDRLIIATGAKPFIPPIKNIMKNDKLMNGVYTLRTIDDAKGIINDIKKSEKATIIGAGLIGLETAEALVKKGLKVSIVEALPRILANTLDEDMVSIITEEIKKHTTLYTNHIATSVETGNNRVKKIVIKDNATNEEKEIPTDILIIATGCKPDTDLAKSIGCSIGASGGIIVNEKTETSVEDVYAIGDCTEYKDLITKESILIGLGSIVVRQGIAAGVNASGGEYNLPPGVLYTRTSCFFDLEVAAVGPLSSTLEKNTKLVNARFKGSSLPEYYPGGEPVTIKIGADTESNRILYAQAIGDNAAQRINVYASAILKGMTVDEMRKLETAYAPPVAPTLDPLTLAADVCSIKLKKKR